MPLHDAAALADLPDQGMHLVELHDQKILLIREDDTVHALGAECPHAGAALNEGLLHNGRIVCPWHKAAFCIRSGTVLDPPAVDSLSRYDVEIREGRVFIQTNPAAPPAHTDAPDSRHFVIVGGGAAGAVAAQTLREIGFNGRLTMLDQEGEIPYDRTLLSKYALSGEDGSEKSPLQTEDFYQQQHIDRIAAQVTALDPSARRITCADGSTLTFDAALLATGATPVKPDLPGADLGNVFCLRNRGDADAIVAQAEKAQRAIVLGTSFIGMEVAASLRQRGLSVTVISQDSVPFEKLLGTEVGGALAALHTEQGVTFRLGRKIKALEGDANVQTVVLDDDTHLAADLVIVGFGVRPATSFLSTLPLNKDGSVTVDANLRVADALYAAGDIARYPDHSAAIRVEHWRVAQQHGRIAAHNMAGGNRRFDAVPYFWTIQYGNLLDYVGHADGWDDLAIHGDLQQQDFIVYYIKSGIVTAAACMGRDLDTAALIELFNQRRDWTPGDLGDNPAAHLARAP